ARERAGDNDAACGRRTGGRLALVPDENLKLVDQRRPYDRLLREGELLLAVLKIGAGAGERRAADASILVALVLVARTERDGIPVADLMREAAGEERPPVRLRRDVLNRTGRSEREDDRLLIVLLIVRR